MKQAKEEQSDIGDYDGAVLVAAIAVALLTRSGQSSTAVGHVF